MVTDKCEHVWRKSTDSSLNINGPIPAFYACEKCRTIMSLPEVLQLEALENQNETLKHTKGFVKWISIIALLVSVAALMVSILK